MNQEIPLGLITVVSDALGNYYFHNGLEEIFSQYSKLSDSDLFGQGGNRVDKVKRWLRLINQSSIDPLSILGKLIAEFMDQPTIHNPINLTEQMNHERKDKILKALNMNGLQYYIGGTITTCGGSPSVSLQKLSDTMSLSSVDLEIKRALANVEKDPMSAAHNAASLLEAAFKYYCNESKISYNEEVDNMSDLWKKVSEHARIKPKDLESNDLKQIASGLHSVVHGIMNLRNKRSASHGKSEDQLRNNFLKPRHAKLALHASSSLSHYFLELLNDKKYEN